MNSSNITLEEVYSFHEIKCTCDEIIRFLNIKHSISFNIASARIFFDSAVMIARNGKPILVSDVFKFNRNGQSFKTFNNFLLQGLFIKTNRRYILSDKGKMILFEYMSLIRNDIKKEMRSMTA